MIDKSNLGEIIKFIKQVKEKKDVIRRFTSVINVVYNKNNYLNHILNNHSTKEERKEKFKYYCNCCDFCVFVKSMMDNHFNTNKHQLKFNDSQNINI